jgi:CubicO group peptidase (beta-lactamase class C family)
MSIISSTIFFRFFRRLFLRLLKLSVGSVLLLLISCGTWSPVIESMGVDDALPTRAGSTIFGQNSNTMNALSMVEAVERHRLHNVVVGIDGEIILERYYNERDEGSIHDIRSATKSITAILVGIAIENEIISGIDMPIADILQPEYPDLEIPRDLTVYDLLIMSSGKECNDWSSDSPGNENRMYRRRDWTEFFLSLEQIMEPGAIGSYCTGGVVTLGRILEIALSRPFDQWADEVLFKPLGIQNYRWEYYNRGRSVDTGGHLHISPRGLIAIGFMLLNGGLHGDESVLSSEWITEMWTHHTSISGQPYGYLWWLHTVDYGFGPIEVYTARGNGGQSLFLVPSLGLSAVIMTSYFNDPKAVVSDELFFYAILPDVIAAYQSN